MEVILLDIKLILVIVFGLIFIVGGTLAGHYANKVSSKDIEETKE